MLSFYWTRSQTFHNTFNWCFNLASKKKMAPLFKIKWAKSAGDPLFWLHLWMFQSHGRKPGFTEIIWAGEKSLRANHSLHDVKLAHRLFMVWYYVDMQRMDNKLLFFFYILFDHKRFLTEMLYSWSIVREGSGGNGLNFNLQQQSQLHYSWSMN